MIIQNIRMRNKEQSSLNIDIDTYDTAGALTVLRSNLKVIPKDANDFYQSKLIFNSFVNDNFNINMIF